MSRVHKNTVIEDSRMPTLTTVNTTTINEDTAYTYSYTSLKTAANESADVSVFKITELLNGSLKIGTRVITAADIITGVWYSSAGITIGSTFFSGSLVWTPQADYVGTEAAFSILGATAINGVLSAGNVNVNFNVTNVNDAGLVTISGTPTQGQTLTALVSDLDGLPGVINYQWKAGTTNISGATSSTYTLTEAQVGKTITCLVTYTDLRGSAESRTSAATLTVANINDAVTGGVLISGTVTQGQTLTASNTLADPDGMGTISYQWKANGVNLSTGTTRVLTQAEVGKVITVTASYTDGHGTVESVTSNATSPVVNVNDALTGTVTITGTKTQGQTLTASKPRLSLQEISMRVSFDTFMTVVVITHII